MSPSRSSRSRSAPPLLVRFLLLLPLSLALVIVTAVESSANVWYEAWFSPAGEYPPTALLQCGFPRQENRHLPDCLITEPMGLYLHAPQMEGELTAIVFRMGSDQGEIVFQVPSDDSTIPFDDEDCALLRTWTHEEDGEVFTPFFVVIETTTHPEGELSGRLKVLADRPTLEQSWGEIKSLYVGP